jgi:tripartite-type tricarboxylate transporter receptor subunit TctC
MKKQLGKAVIALFGPMLFLLLFIHLTDAQVIDSGKYPTRPITCVVPFSAGGSTDLAVRLLTKEAEKHLGQPITVVNKAGGGGTVGVATVASAKPDGYTIGQSPGGSPLFILPYLEKIPYHPLKDLRFIVEFVDQSFGVLVKADAPFKSFQDVILSARQNPGKVTYGTNAPNSILNLVIEQAARKEKVQFTHIPFKSSPEFQAAVLGGHITFCGGDFNYSLIESNQLRLLAVTSERRSPEYPDVPTLKELGYETPCPVFLGILAPKGIPDDAAKKLEEVFARALKEPGVVKGMKELRLTILYRNGKEFTDYVAHNYEVFGKLLKEMGLVK